MCPPFVLLLWDEEEAVEYAKISSSLPIIDMRGCTFHMCIIKGFFNKKKWTQKENDALIIYPDGIMETVVNV